MDNNINSLVAEIKRLLAKKPKILGAYPQSGNNKHHNNWQLIWHDAKLPAQPPEFSDSLLADERSLMRQKMLEFFAHNLGNEDAPVLLVQAVAGMGKSTTAIQVAQEIARMGYRILYLMPRHDYWQDLVSNPFFNADLWLHWLSFDGTNEDGNKMCRYPKAIKSLALSGYNAVDGCKKLCGLAVDNHIAVCPYRAQARTKKPIIAGVHNHLTTGLSMEFDLIIVDESVLATMVAQKFIPAKFLQATNDHQTVQLLMQKLSQLALNHKIYNGFDLAHLLQSELSIIFQAIKDDLITFSKPELPESFDETTQMKYWYILDFLRLMAVEYQLWQQGEVEGMSRIKLDATGLTLYLKNDDFWQTTPKIILDATGESATITNLLNKPVVKHAPNIGLKGRVFQLVNRLNNITALYDKERSQLTKAGQELGLLIKHIRHSKPLKNGYGKYNRVGLITFKSLRPFYEPFADIALHFGGNRGTNIMENVDCLIVAGAPSPSDYDILNLANQMLFADDLDVNANIIGNRPYRTNLIKPYLYSQNNKQPHRLISSYDNPVLERVLGNFRESELIQSLYRARPLTNDCDIYLLTAVPLPVWLTKLHDNPNELVNLPDIKLSHYVRILPYCTDEYIPLNEVVNGTQLSKAQIYAIVSHNPIDYQLNSTKEGLFFRGAKCL